MAPADRPALPRSEVLLRGITNQHWDADTLSPSLFEGYEGSEVSVSREAILSREEIIEIFKAHLQRPATPEKPERKLWGYAVFNVGDLVDWVNEFIVGKSPAPSPVKAVADPTQTPPPPNPAHALLAPRTTRGMAKMLRKKLRENREVYRIPGVPPVPEWPREHPSSSPQEPDLEQGVNLT